MRSDEVLAIDIGGSKLSVGIVLADGTVLHQEKFFWDALDAESVLATIINASRRMMKEGRPTRAGVNIPGLADIEKGLWVEACFSGIQNVPIAGILTEELEIPVALDNDVNNCALAEKLFGICRDCSDFVWLTVSNGCGGAVYLEDHLYRGIRGTAGEIGHICVEEVNGRLCGCGNHGCLEAQAAGPGIAARYKTGGGARVANRDMSAAEIADMARKGDPLAVDVYEKEGYYIGKALASVINVLNPQKAVIGGGVAGAFDLFSPTMIDTVRRMTYHRASAHVSIEKTGLGYDAALIGAAALALGGKKDAQIY